MENIKEFLKELQEEMNTQDHDSQADPRFWSIRDYRWVETDIDNAERTVLFSPSVCEIETLESYVEDLKERIDEFDITEADVKQLEEYVKYGEDDDLLAWIHKNDDEDYYLFYEKEEVFIVPNTMFLLKREAKEHLVANKHHYTSKAHTYAMTAWRSPSVSKLYEVLENTNWDEVNFNKVTK